MQRSRRGSVDAAVAATVQCLFDASRSPEWQGSHQLGHSDHDKTWRGKVLAAPVRALAEQAKDAGDPGAGGDD
jgi:hypothetical protein